MKNQYDEPITKIQDDLLQREDFVKIFVDDLFNIQKGKNITIALNGKWGSGKTSLINLIKTEIYNRLKNQEKNKNFPLLACIDFAPWNVLDENAIIEQFFDAIGKSLKINNILKEAGFTILDIISKFSSYFGVASLSIKHLSSLVKKYKQCIVENKNDLMSKKLKIERTLAKIKYKYVVFIDDIDRLNKKEIKLIMQLIKSVFNFPNIIFVLAFDKDIVAHALKGEQEESGYQYLDKIIQLSIDVPDVPKHILNALLQTEIKTLIFQNNCINYDESRFHLLNQNCYRKYFDNIRKIKTLFKLYKFQDKKVLQTNRCY